METKKEKNARLQVMLPYALVGLLYAREVRTGAKPSASIALALKAWKELKK